MTSWALATDFDWDLDTREVVSFECWGIVGQTRTPCRR